jgi:SAM-dependent methyltransferase
MDVRARFSNRVEDYVRYRPGYPAEVVETLIREHGVSTADSIADLGSGTGISSRLFLAAGFEVFAVEPNEPMRGAAERDSATFAHFHSTAGSAEATTLPAGSVGIALAAQAFHWFDRPRARAEMERILREPRLVVLLWNERRVEGPFLTAYEKLLFDRGVDYGAVRHQDTANPDVVREFFGPAPAVYTFANPQKFDREGLFGRARSSSYVPKPEHPSHDAFFAELGALYDRHSEDGFVTFAHDTRMYVGRLDPR